MAPGAAGTRHRHRRRRTRAPSHRAAERRGELGGRERPPGTPSSRPANCCSNQPSRRARRSAPQQRWSGVRWCTRGASQVPGVSAGRCWAPRVGGATVATHVRGSRGDAASTDSATGVAGRCRRQPEGRHQPVDGEVEGVWGAVERRTSPSRHRSRGLPGAGAAGCAAQVDDGVRRRLTVDPDDDVELVELVDVLEGTRLAIGVGRDTSPGPKPSWRRAARARGRGVDVDHAVPHGRVAAVSSAHWCSARVSANALHVGEHLQRLRLHPEDPADEHEADVAGVFHSA